MEATSIDFHTYNKLQKLGTFVSYTCAQCQYIARKHTELLRWDGTNVERVERWEAKASGVHDETCLLPSVNIV